MARAYDKGSLYGVSLNADEIDAFRRRWPASGLNRLRSLYAAFDRRNGDLVELTCNRSGGSCQRFDGPALGALADDAQCWGAAKLGQIDFKTEQCSTRTDWHEYLGAPKPARPKPKPAR